MKRIQFLSFFIGFLMIFLGCKGFAGDWNVTPHSPTYYPNSIAMSSNGGTIYVTEKHHSTSNYSGVVEQSIDSGKSWRNLEFGNLKTYRPVSVATSSNGHVIAVASINSDSESQIYVDHNGKYTYQDTTDFKKISLSSIAMSSNGRTIAVVGNDKFGISVDGGKTWNLKAVDVQLTKLNLVAMSSSSTGHCNRIIVGGATNNGEGEIAISGNKGNSWTYIPFTEIASVNSVSMSSGGKYIVVAGDGAKGESYILESNDFGANWGRVYNTEYYDINNVSVSDNGIIVIADREKNDPNKLVVKKSTDSGKSWPIIHKTTGKHYSIFNNAAINQTGDKVFFTESGKFLVYRPYNMGEGVYRPHWVTEYSGVIGTYNL
jgi:photosystem II stability/assembly factor-like uncharacterized protein